MLGFPALWILGEWLRGPLRGASRDLVVQFVEPTTRGVQLLRLGAGMGGKGGVEGGAAAVLDPDGCAGGGRKMRGGGGWRAPQ